MAAALNLHQQHFSDSLLALFARSGYDAAFPVLFCSGVMATHFVTLRNEPLRGSVLTHLRTFGLGGAIGLAAAGLLVGVLPMPVERSLQIAARLSIIYGVTGLILGLGCGLVSELCLLAIRCVTHRVDVHPSSYTGIVLVLVLVILTASWVLAPKPFDVVHYRGEGTASDMGYWAYPRYRIAFNPIVVGRDCIWRARLNALPAIPWTVKLVCSDVRDAQTLEDQEVVIEVTLIAEPGETVCYVARDPIKSWEVMRGSEVALWHDKLRGIVTDSKTDYTLVVGMQRGRVADGECQLTPVIEGGGYEPPKYCAR